MKKFETVAEYIQEQPTDIAARLKTIQALFHELLPDTKESIRYQILSFSVGSHYLYVSAYKKHIGMYPMYGIPELEEELAPYRGKGTKDSLHFAHSAPLPLDLIRKIIIAKSA